MRRDLARRVEALEEDANPAISTWADLVVAVEEGRDPIAISPAMQSLFNTTAPRSV